MISCVANIVKLNASIMMKIHKLYIKVTQNDTSNVTYDRMLISNFANWFITVNCNSMDYKYYPESLQIASYVRSFCLFSLYMHCLIKKRLFCPILRLQKKITEKTLVYLHLPHKSLIFNNSFTKFELWWSKPTIKLA